MHERLMCLLSLIPEADWWQMKNYCMVLPQSRISWFIIWRSPGWSTEAGSSSQCLSWKHLLVNMSLGHDWHALSLVCVTKSRGFIFGPLHLKTTLLLFKNGACDDLVHYLWVRCWSPPLLIQYQCPTFTHSCSVTSRHAAAPREGHWGELWCACCPWGIQL